MPPREVIRGDAYALRRPLWEMPAVDADGNPFDFSGCTVRVTYKPVIVPIEDDPQDATAVIQHTIMFDASGTPTTTDGLYLVAPGIIEERWTAEETAALPTGVPLLSDIQITDANGEPWTFLFTDTVTAKDSVTNRWP